MREEGFGVLDVHGGETLDGPRDGAAVLDAAADDVPDDVSGSVSILLVEDDHGDAVLVQACLSEVGVPDAAVQWTRTLGDALMETAVTPPDCVLLDLGLPDADGFSAVPAMVAAAPDSAVIVLTGRRERDGIDALAAGAQDYLPKDTLTGELLERSIRYAVERKRAQHTQQQLREFRLSAAEQARLERGLLPRPLLRTDAIGWAAYYKPGRDNAVLGGDFYDVVEMDDGRIRAIIGDVMGHGPDEAALGVHLRVAWRTLLLAGAPDQAVLPIMADLLRAETGGDLSHYVTICDVTLAGTTLTTRVAGHPAPILSTGGDAGYLDVKVGPPLGVRLASSPVPWPDTEVGLPPGSVLTLYSDGLLDAYAGPQVSDSLGIDELVAAISARIRTGRPADTWIEDLVTGAPLEPVDDTAAVVLTTRPPA